MTNPTGDLQNRAPSAESAPQPGPAATLTARRGLLSALISAARLRQSAGSNRSATDLQIAVSNYVVALRTDGATVEQSVISIKELVATAIGGPHAPPERRALAEQVVSWGINEYYDSASRAD